MLKSGGNACGIISPRGPTHGEKNGAILGAFEKTGFFRGKHVRSLRDQDSIRLQHRGTNAKKYCCTTPAPSHGKKEVLRFSRVCVRK
jgi:hypothetical protein